MKLLRQGLNFGIVGAIQLLLDWSVFVGSTALGVPVSAANLAGRITGASLGFWLNGHLTFRGEVPIRLIGRPLKRFIAMWLLLTLLGTLMVMVVGSQASLRAAWLAKPIVEAVLAAISFVTCRYWVYR
jgi:putative flippase GtrA